MGSGHYWVFTESFILKFHRILANQCFIAVGCATRKAVENPATGSS